MATPTPKPRRALKARPVRATPVKSKPRTRSQAVVQQTFTVSHHRDADFRRGRCAHDRDLGISQATWGMVQAACDLIRPAMST